MERPIIEIPVTESDTNMERICRVAILLLWVGTILCYFYVLPNTIPIHYNLKDQPDGFGSRSYIFITPGIATALYILLSFVARYPHRFNYLKPVTEENAARMYTSAVRLLRVAKMYVILGFFFQTANDVLSLKYVSFHNGALSVILEWAPVILVAAGVIAYMLDERRLRDKQQ